MHLEHGVEADEADLTGLQHPPVVVGEHRQQHLVPETRLRAVPVDVEVARVAAGRPVLQHVPPPGVFRAGGHVVGHDVEDLAQAPGLQGGIEPGVGGAAPELLVDPPVVDDVVAVGAARCRLQVGRAVEVGDAQRRQIPGERRRLVKTEAGPELHPIGTNEIRHAAGAPGSGPSPSVPRLPRR